MLATFLGKGQNEGVWVCIFRVELRVLVYLGGLSVCFVGVFGWDVCVFEEHVHLRDVCACGWIWGLLEGCGQACLCVCLKGYVLLVCLR